MKKLNFILTMIVMASVPAFGASNYEYTEAEPVAVDYTQTQYDQNYSQRPSRGERPDSGNRPQRENSQYSSTETSYDNSALQGSVITVPAGQSLPAVVTTPLSSENLTLGQSVSLALGSDFYYGGNLIAPSGSTVTGTVLEVSKAKRGSMNGKLLVRFTQITTPYGVQIPISAVIKTTDESGLLVGGTKMDVTKAYAKDVAIGAGAGALAGVIISPLAGGSIGKGTALATGVGAGAGVAKSIWDKGEEVEIPVNSTVEISLTQPITVNPSTYNRNY